jgi:hypothetical protein
MNYTLDDSFAWDVSYRQEWSKYDNKTDLTPTELLEVIKGVDKSVSIGNDDHPEFKKLRNQLEAEGYIKCERSWWNGDRVLKPFTLNGVDFNVDGNFPCGAAMKIHLEIERKYRG